MNSISLNVALDLDSPGAFLSTYKFLLGREKPNRNRSLISTTKRLMCEYMSAQKDLMKAMAIEVSGLRGWMKKRKTIKAMKNRLNLVKQKLMSWVSTTISFFKS